MRRLRFTAVPAVLLAGAFALSGCSAASAPAVAPPPRPPATEAFESDPNGEWNIFPDPTTGEVGIYRDGEYLGAITGDEPEDPPIPHKTRHDNNVQP